MATENERTEFCCWAGAVTAPDACPWHQSSEGQSPSANAPGTGGSPNPEQRKDNDLGNRATPRSSSPDAEPSLDGSQRHWYCLDCGIFDGPITDGCCDACDPLDAHSSGVVEMVPRKRGMNTVEDIGRCWRCHGTGEMDMDRGQWTEHVTCMYCQGTGDFQERRKRGRRSSDQESRAREEKLREALRRIATQGFGRWDRDRMAYFGFTGEEWVHWEILARRALTDGETV